MAPASTRNPRGANRQADTPPRPRSRRRPATTPCPVRAPWNTNVTSFSSAPAGARCSRKSVLHPDHRGQLDRRRIVSGRHRDHRGRIDADQPAGAPPVPLADRCRKRRPGALSQLAERPRQVRRRVRDDHQVVGHRIRQRRSRPTRRTALSRARASSARLPGCTRAITIGTSLRVPPSWHRRRPRHRASNSPTAGGSTICRNTRPVSEFHHAPNAAFSDDCCSARTRASPIFPPRLGTAP